MKEVEGFIISEVAYKENSKIINIITEQGIIGVMAKGAKSLKSNLRVATSKFTYGKFLINYKNDKLSILLEATIKNDLMNIKTDIYLISYLSYIVELTSQVAKQTTNLKELYYLFIDVINKLNEKVEPRILTNIYELKILDYLGVGINFDSCSKCGNKTNIITVDGDVGGYVCKDCYTNEIIYDQKTLKTLRLYYLININTISKLNIDKKVSNNIDRFISTYYDRYTGLYLNSKKFLNNLEQM